MWHLVHENSSRLRISDDHDGKPSGVPLYIGSTGITFKAPRRGSRRVEKMVYGAFSGEDLANARLIASAPELFEACKDAIGVLDCVAYEVKDKVGELKETDWNPQHHLSLTITVEDARRVFYLIEKLESLVR